MNRKITRGLSLILFAIYIAIAFNFTTDIFYFTINYGKIFSAPIALWAIHYIVEGTK